MAAMRLGPPRGMRQSSTSLSCMKATAASCEGSATSATPSAGSPWATRAWRHRSTMKRFEPRADADPRKNAAFPLRTQRPATSLVTLGRFS